jgi:ABC-type tungstate transport system substrate-binding protein
MEMEHLGRVVLIAGLLIAAVGLTLMLGGRVPYLGRLPGDISFRWGGGSFYFPLMTSIVVSILVTIALNLLLRLFNRS